MPCRAPHSIYKRHGTTTLFAALDVLEGRVIGQCMARHRHQEFIRFLNKINRETPAGRELHLIVDNYATHKHPKVQAWLGRHKRFHFHFTPTSALLAQRGRGVLRQANPAAAQGQSERIQGLRCQRIGADVCRHCATPM